MAWEIVIAGGGFGGLYAARELERRLPPEAARVTLVSDVNFLTYTPLLPGAAAGTLEPRHVVVPLREELSSTRIRLGHVESGDPARRELAVRPIEGEPERLRYDHLIVALGSVSRVPPVPGLDEHGIGFKTISEAIALRNRALLHLETAEALDDPERRREHLTFVFVGAGYAGVEGIAELQDYVADVIERYPRCRLEGTRWVLVEALDRLMPEIPEDLAEFAAGELRHRGIELRTGEQLASVDAGGATLASGERIPARTVCWTAGVTPPGVVRRLGLPVDARGRIVTDRAMRVPGHEGVWAIGDAAAVPDPAKKDGSPCPPTAQHALRQGKVVARNVAASIGRGRVRPFRYKTKGVFVDLGRHEAVATMLGVRLRGTPAYMAARLYHLAMIPGWARRFRLLADWSVGTVFGRGSAELGQLGHPPRLAAEATAPTAPAAPAAPAQDGAARDAAGAAAAPASSGGPRGTGPPAETATPTGAS